MKLFIVASLRECQEDVIDIFKKANIRMYSTLGVTGSKDNNGIDISEDWFASGDAKFDSLVQFSFTSNENASQGMEIVKAYNESKDSKFPIRAFILAVENSSH
ncbi:MAG: hypothetical protein ABS68_07625 [Niastella sp. SCN 39-18]|nr:hypothetical protein [Sphingobacteriales bacterium]ODT52451.1 MAG: hypothetical protein ABS68_07625 [Niastella sp. SCN 39-18]OJW11588.1 MAG: hypothetical protein BGO53_11690 [Sphingobacteriales bacterium 39-19]